MNDQDCKFVIFNDARFLCDDQHQRSSAILPPPRSHVTPPIALSDPGEWEDKGCWPDNILIALRENKCVCNPSLGIYSGTLQVSSHFQDSPRLQAAKCTFQ